MWPSSSREDMETRKGGGVYLQGPIKDVPADDGVGVAVVQAGGHQVQIADGQRSRLLVGLEHSSCEGVRRDSSCQTTATHQSLHLQFLAFQFLS